MNPSSLLSSRSSRLRGDICVPGDKSISHRALILSAIAEGSSQITGFLPSEDCLSTMCILRDLGVQIHSSEVGEAVEVVGRGVNAFSAPLKDLDCANSGTAMRLLSGLLAALPFSSRLVGDASLMTRPMRRVVDPLCAMGGKVSCADNDCAPLVFQPVAGLHGFNHKMTVASAQVVSCLLIAGLLAEGESKILEKSRSRDHTERLLWWLSGTVRRQGLCLHIKGGAKLTARDISIAGDMSSAAFFIAAASIIDNSALLIRSVGINSLRLGCVRILQRMGADIEFLNQSKKCNEYRADIRVRASRLRGVDIEGQEVTDAVDEIPILMLCATQAQGTTRIRGAQELRYKESDRLAVMCRNLSACGADIEETPDGAIISGKRQLHGVELSSFGDHRVAMAMAVAGAVSSSPIRIHDCRNIATSFPDFWHLARQAGLCLSSDDS